MKTQWFAIILHFLKLCFYCISRSFSLWRFLFKCILYESQMFVVTCALLLLICTFTNNITFFCKWFPMDFVSCFMVFIFCFLFSFCFYVCLQFVTTLQIENWYINQIQCSEFVCVRFCYWNFSFNIPSGFLVFVIHQINEIWAGNYLLVYVCWFCDLLLI